MVLLFGFSAKFVPFVSGNLKPGLPFHMCKCKAFQDSLSPSLSQWAIP